MSGPECPTCRYSHNPSEPHLEVIAGIVQHLTFDDADEPTAEIVINDQHGKRRTVTVPPDVLAEADGIVRRGTVIIVTGEQEAASHLQAVLLTSCDTERIV